MRTDWQAFLDGSMDASERAHVEKLLKTDPAAKRELDGLVALRDTVRTAGVSVPVPLERLSAGLKRIAPQPVRRPWQIVAAASLVLVAITTASVSVYRVIFSTRDSGGTELVYSLPYAGVVNRKAMTDIRQFVQRNSGISNSVPVLASVGALKMVHCGRGWACYDYLTKSGKIHMYVDYSTGPPSDCKTLPAKGGDIYVFESKRATGFDLDGLRYTFTGCGSSDCSEVARLALEEISQDRA